MNSSFTEVLVNPLMQRLRQGGLGLALAIRHARTVDIALAARSCGFDAVYFDLQHTSVPEDTVAQIAVAALGAGITPLVRVPDRDYAAALRMLDAGALGIVFPEVASAEEARQAVACCKFAPIGHRSALSGWPHFGYRAVPAVEARRLLNDNTLVIVMLESAAAIDRVEEIAAVPGVDIVHVGVNDLSTDFSFPGELTHPKVISAVEQVIAACSRHSKVAGVGGLGNGDGKRFEQMAGLGARFFSAASEWGLMMAAGQDRVRAMRALLPG